MITARDARTDLKDRLRQGSGADGGWGYYDGKTARLEPTAWMALAPTADRDGAVTRLQRWPARDGLLMERAGGDANYGFHGLALLALQARGGDHAVGTAALVDGIQRVKGERLEVSEPNGRQDNRLQAWSWIRGTFSWVEPTAWCMLALKKWASSGGSADRARLNEAERLLVNRTCVGGGWNYGNSDVLGKNLHPYLPTTAAALLALQDRRDLDVVGRSLDYLEANATSERSAGALALTMIALRIYGRDVKRAESALLAQLPTTIALGNRVALAVAAYALDPDQSYDAFTL
jgi:hypothetical protein